MNMVRGWCPTAWTPMAAGDGLLLRVRPRLARLSREQALALCEVAHDHGNGELDLTNRAAIQIRGARDDWPDAVARLAAAGLVDPDPEREASPALLVAPDWRPDDDTHRIATDLLATLPTLPPLPVKIGIAVDAGPAAVLTDAPGDFRIERGRCGGLILRADGHATGIAVASGGEVAALRALVDWFVATGGRAAGRMARHAVPLPRWATGGAMPLGEAPPLRPGAHALGTAIALPFGRITAAHLAHLLRSDGATGLRLTPWRIAIVDGAAVPAGDSALLSIDACVGAPACPQATVATRSLAERLAPHIAGSLHVSGCAKGCARGRPADVTLTGRDGGFDLAYGARAGAPPVASGLPPADLIARFESR